MEAEPRLGRLPQIGQKVDRYTVIAEVAHGGMAAVYAARRTVGTFDKLLALKVMLPHLVGEPQFVDMFLDESRIAAHVQHPNVVQVFDVGQFDNTPFMVMEFLRGQSLSRVLKRGATSPEAALPTGGLLAVLAAAATGLHAAHSARGTAGERLQIVHRDVSPQNIHVGYDGVVRVVDFGIAAARGRATQTRTGEIKGKLAYMAPEQLRGERSVDHRADLWALGVIAWESLTGERLFRADTEPDTIWNVLHRELEPLVERRPDLPQDLIETIERCVSRDPADRPDSAAIFAESLRASGKAWSAEQLRDHMTRTFEDERVREQEQLTSWSAGPPSPLDETSEVRTRSEPSVGGPRAPVRWGLSLAAAALVIAVGAVGVVGWARYREADPEPSVAPAEPSREPTLEPVGAAPTRDDSPHELAAEPEHEPSAPVPVAGDSPVEPPAPAGPERRRRALRRGRREAEASPPAAAQPVAPTVDPALMEIPR